jgi:hypothetical protein
VHHPALEVRVERLLRPLADADHAGAGLEQAAHELALVRGKRRLEEDHVHDCLASAGSIDSYSAAYFAADSAQPKCRTMPAFWMRVHAFRSRQASSASRSPTRDHAP